MKYIQIHVRYPNFRYRVTLFFYAALITHDKFIYISILIQSWVCLNIPVSSICFFGIINKIDIFTYLSLFKKKIKRLLSQFCLFILLSSLQLVE